jgi:hypothetical protein
LIISRTMFRAIERDSGESSESIGDQVFGVEYWRKGTCLIYRIESFPSDHALTCHLA